MAAKRQEAIFGPRTADVNFMVVMISRALQNITEIKTERGGA